MSPPDGPDRPHPDDWNETRGAGGRVEYLLFESLLHHLLEKGVLSKNDALSVVQTAAEVTQGRLNGGAPDADVHAGLKTLRRLYSSLELVSSNGQRPAGNENVTELRPPAHADRPKFPPQD